MGIFIDGHEVKLPGDKLALRVTAVKQGDGTEITPATSENIAALTAAMQGTGLPIPLAVSDPGDNEWSAAIDPNPITRDCTRLFYRVGSSGFELSFDGGETVHLTRPEDTADDIAIAIPNGSDVRIRRLTAGTAIDGLIVEVR